MLKRIRELINTPRNAIPFLFVLLSLLVLLVLLVLPLGVGANSSSMLDNSGRVWRTQCDTTPIIGETYHHEGSEVYGERWCINENGAFLFSDVCTLIKVEDRELIFRSDELCMIDYMSCATETAKNQFELDITSCEIAKLWQRI